MDDVDRQLIGYLRRDARVPVSTLSDLVGVSRATVRNRIERLCDIGVIRGFTIEVGKDVSDSHVHAITMIEVEGKAAEAVAERLRDFPEITKLFSTNGRWDLIAELEVASLQAFDDVLRLLRLVDGITLTETHILLAPRQTAGSKLT